MKHRIKQFTIISASMMSLLATGHVMANDATSAEIKSYSADLINPVVVENVIAKASAGGAWSNSATGPTLYTKGQYDTISLKPVLITIETQPASTGVVALEPFDSRS